MCLLLLGILIGLLFAIWSLLPAIPQGQAYNNFVDNRSFFHIPNTLNVLSNVPFAMVGLWGLFLLSMPQKVLFIDSRERWPWVGFSIGLIFVGLNSGYYHFSPSNSRLVWDRLSMVVTFTSYAAALICDRINVRLGLWLWPIFLCIGIASVLVWISGEAAGKDDVSLYLSIQAFCMLLSLIILFVPPAYTRSSDIAVALFFYVLAVLFDRLDEQIYQLSDRMISGHTLKHIAAAFASFWLIRMLLKRKRRSTNGEKKYEI